MHNPTRRNRNIGTAKQGYGQNNCMTIPESWHDAHIFFEKLRNPIRVTQAIDGKDIIFLIEEPLADYRHSCTVGDICQMLRLVPKEDWAGLDIVVLRQPTRKQTILSSVWGRLSWLYEYKELSGVAIVLEAQPRDSVLKWSKSLTPEYQKEIERLSDEGHEIQFDKKFIVIRSGLSACRNTQLFRTLPHEIGHYCHYQRVNNEDRYQAMPHNEKEAAAHRYAEELSVILHKEGKIPFSQLHDALVHESCGLKTEWFQ